MAAKVAPVGGIYQLIGVAEDMIGMNEEGHVGRLCWRKLLSTIVLHMYTSLAP